MYFQANENLINLGRNFANVDDIFGAYKGLIQLQITYKLDTYKMAKGLIHYKGFAYQGMRFLEI